MQKNKSFLAVATVVAISVLSGCAGAGAATGAGAGTTNSSPGFDIPAAGFVQESPKVSLDWADVNAKLTPLAPTDTSLVSASTAFATIRKGVTGVLASMSPSGPPTAALYSYTNTAHGQIQADGSVKLSYTNIPVWKFAIPLTKFVDLSQGGFTTGDTISNVKQTDCFYYYIVQASDGTFLTSSEECTVDDPNIPDPSPAK